MVYMVPHGETHFDDHSLSTFGEIITFIRILYTFFPGMLFIIVEFTLLGFAFLLPYSF